MATDKYQVPIDLLMDYSPFEGCVWLDQKDPLTVEDIAYALEARRIDSSPYSSGRGDPGRPGYHAERVAYLVQHPSKDPILIDVGIGCHALGAYINWPIVDGHHRLAAAIYRGDAHIAAYMVGGEFEIERFLTR